MSGRHPVHAAITYARRGWAVFPLYCPVRSPGGGVRCSCGHLDCTSIGKHPRAQSGLYAATTDELQIRAWWGRWPSAGVAIRTGRPSGLVVIDIDPAHRGEWSLERIVATRGPLPATRTVRTGGGGRHLYFAHPGHVLPNTAGRLGPGIDTRADGGYVIAPPSRHRSGATYELAADGDALPQLPAWALTELETPTLRPFTSGPGSGDATAWGRAVMDGELHRLDGAQEGTRNDTLNRVAFRLGQIVGAGVLNEGDVERRLVEHGIGTGLLEREVVDTVHRGLRAGEAAPRGPSHDRNDDTPWPAS